MQVRADTLDAEGRAVCRGDELEIRVESLLPGETAEVEIAHRSPHRALAWARLVQRLGEPSPDRVTPACPAFGRCGGCSLQHLAYPAQLVHKRQRVEAALGAASDAVVGAPAELGYRNKGKYVVGEVDGRVVLGGYAPRTHDLVDTLGCQVVAPAIDAMARRARQVLADSGLAVYDERRRAGHLRHVVIREGSAGEVLVAIVTRSGAPRDALARVACALDAHGVVWVRNDSTSGTVMTDDVEPLSGAATVTETVAGVDIDIGATEFFQVNRDQASRMYAELVRRVGAGPSRRAVDVYCGVGGIAFSLAAAGATAIGIERHRASVEAANRAAARANLGSLARFVAGTAAALADHVEPPPDIVVVNPPRKGLDLETRTALAAAEPETIAYVSCDPDSLASDLQHLTEYRLESATVFDLMPGTPVVETLAILRR